MTLTPKQNAGEAAARRLAAAMDPLFPASEAESAPGRAPAGRTPVSGSRATGAASAPLLGPSVPSGARGRPATGPQSPSGGRADAFRSPRPLQPTKRPRQPLRPFRAIVTGSREWATPKTVWTALDTLAVEHPRWPLTVVHDACPTGADQHAAVWARKAQAAGWNVREEPHPARWGELGKAAGPTRNGEMVAAGADVVLAFLRPGSRGTADCVRKAKAAGIPVREFTERGDQ